MALPLLFASILVVPFAYSSAMAHGPPPSGCAMYHGLEYQSEIDSFVVDNGQEQVDIMASPKAIIPVERDGQFSVQFVLHTDKLGFGMENGSRVEAESSDIDGYTWYRDFANGYPYSKCGGPVIGDIDYEVSQDYPVSHMFQGSGPHLIFFETTLDDSRPKAEFYIQVVDDIASAETRDSEIADEQLPTERSEDKEENPFPFLSESNETETASTNSELTGDSLTINGTIASLALPMNVSDFDVPPQRPYIVAGNWLMTVNDTAVSDFKANFTVVSADGLQRESHRIANFTAVNASAVQFDGDLISLASSSSIISGDSVQQIDMAITLEELNAVRIDLDGASAGNVTGPIYGIVDKLVINEGGTIVRVVSP